MDAINGFNGEVNEKVTGVVTIKLYKGTATIVAMTSPFAMHHASFTTNGGYSYNVNASAGFIEVYSLQMKLAHQRKHT
jgi:argininosuccinate synthase